MVDKISNTFNFHNLVMQEINFNRIGIIRKSIHPKEIGWYVAICDDSKNIGGYKIYTSNNKNFTGTADGAEIQFNNWVEHYADIEEFIKGWEWQIDWTNEFLPSEWTG